ADYGAAAFVFRNHIEGSVPPTGEVGYHERPGPIPALGVSSEVGSRLARYAESGCEVTVDVDCRNEPTESRNVAAEVGPDTEEEVLVTAHVDAHDIADGANDNGAGSALVAEIGRLLNHVVNLDGACSSRNLRVGSNGFDALTRLFEGVTDDLDSTLSTNDTISPHGDQWAFVQEGVPAAMVSTTSEQSGRGWGHTHADTLDKLDSRDLRAVAVQVAEGVVRLANGVVEPEHRTREEMRDRIDEGYVQELKQGGRWPYEE
ncbi:MAG: M28 family peptidase, partial [Halobaculum sp.]